MADLVDVEAMGLQWRLVAVDPVGWNVEREIRENGMWEVCTTKKIEPLIQPGDVFVDVGAHVGWYTMLAASKGADVVAIENDPTFADRLRGHLELNNFTADVLEGMAMDGAITIDGLDLKKCHWIKIDTDGWELQVIRGARQTLAEHRPAVIFEVGPAGLEVIEKRPAADVVRDLFDELSQHGYQFMWSNEWRSVDATFCVDWCVKHSSTMDVFATVAGRNLVPR